MYYYLNYMSYYLYDHNVGTFEYVTKEFTSCEFYQGVSKTVCLRPSNILTGKTEKE